MCCVPMLRWVCLVCLQLCKEEGFAITERRDIGMYEVSLSMFFLDGDYVSQLSYVWYYVGIKNSFQHAREECESKRAYVF